MLVVYSGKTLLRLESACAPNENYPGRKQKGRRGEEWGVGVWKVFPILPSPFPLSPIVSLLWCVVCVVVSSTAIYVSDRRPHVYSPEISFSEHVNSSIALGCCGCRRGAWCLFEFFYFTLFMIFFVLEKMRQKSVFFCVCIFFVVRCSLVEIWLREDDVAHFP